MKLEEVSFSFKAGTAKSWLEDTLFEFEKELREGSMCESDDVKLDDIEDRLLFLRLNVEEDRKDLDLLWCFPLETEGGGPVLE